MENNKSVIHVYKDTQGQSWFVGIYSNNFKDREDEILAWDGHLEYAKWVNETGIKLPITVAHLPKYRAEVHVAQLIGLVSGKFSAKEFSDNYMKMYKPFAFAQTEAVIPVNGFMLVIGKILNGKENAVKLLSKSGWGMSHGYLALDRDEKVINTYRTFEFTSLPMALAANAITISSMIKDNGAMEIKGLTEQDRKTLKTLLDVDPAELEQATLAAQDVLKKVLDNKAVDTDDVLETEAEEEVVQADYETIREKIFADMGVEQLNKSFGTLVDTLTSVVQRLDALEPRVKETERSEDEKIAQTFFKPNWDIWNKAVTQDDDLSEEEVEALQDHALGNKAIDGVDATTADHDNPLYLGWMKPMGFDK